MEDLFPLGPERRMGCRNRRLPLAAIRMSTQLLQPVHPGDVLLEEFLKPMELSQNSLARALGVAPRRINEIVLRKRAMTADTALRLSRYFGNSPEFWLGLQLDYDLDMARIQAGPRIDRE